MYTACTARVTSLAVVLAAVAWAASAGPQAVFANPEEAAKALLATLQSEDYSRFLWVAGEPMAGFWNSGDPERDALERGRFVTSARRNGMRVIAEEVDRRLIYAGRMQEPFPAPLVKTGSGWRFDGEAGLRELAARRIHDNEIAVIEICQRFYEAEYAFRGMSTGGVVEFASRIRSTPGRHDGLFWTNVGEEDQSPMGPPFAAAAYAERQPNDETQPLFGYYFKILSAQGPDAAGGAVDYRTKGRLRKGFALIAWPAEYGVDGTQSFLVNHFGDIYEKDLGTDTTRTAGNMAAFNPDRGWRKFNGLD